MREVIRYNEYVFTVCDVLSPAECLSLIAASEERGYGKALIRTDLGMSDRPDLRNHARLIVGCFLYRKLVTLSSQLLPLCYAFKLFIILKAQIYISKKFKKVFQCFYLYF